MIRALLLLLLLLAPRILHAQDPAPLLLRLVVEQHGPVWLGQRVTVTLTAMTPVRFVDPIAWPDITAQGGRVIVLPEATTTPGTERVGADSYAALSHSYAVFPATPGELVLAPLVVQARVGGPDGQPLAASAATEAAPLTVRVPPGVADVSRLVVAPAFTMEATVEGNTAQLHVGEAVTRTVTMQADDTAAMMLPPAAWTAPDGVRLYPDPPVLQDRSDRGTLHALRRERAAFVPQQPGPVELPGFAVSWLDPRRGQVRQVTVPPLRLQVLPAAAAEPTARPVARWLVAGAVLLLLVALVAAAWRWRRRHPARPDPLAALRRAGGDPREALRALYRWADGLLPPGEARTVARLAVLAATPALAAEAGRLEAVIYGHGASWDARALLHAAEQAERSLRRGTARPRGGALPPLNPFPAAMPAPRLSQPRWVR